jgi:hypothetical protein
MRPLGFALTFGCALLVAAPAQARVSCGDTLRPETRGKGHIVASVSQGRLAGEIEKDPRIAKEPGLNRTIDAATSAERQRLAKAAADCDRAEGRLCWSRVVSVTFLHPQIASALIWDTTEVETLGRPEQNQRAVLWDRRGRRALTLADLLAGGANQVAFDAIEKALWTDFERAKRENDAPVESCERSAYAAGIKEGLQSGRTPFTLKPAEDDPIRATGLVFYYGSGELGSRMEHTYELFVPASAFGDHLKAQWREVFGLKGDAAEACPAAFRQRVVTPAGSEAEAVIPCAAQRDPALGRTLTERAKRDLAAFQARTRAIRRDGARGHTLRIEGEPRYVGEQVISILETVQETAGFWRPLFTPRTTNWDIFRRSPLQLSDLFGETEPDGPTLTALRNFVRYDLAHQMQARFDQVSDPESPWNSALKAEATSFEAWTLEEGTEPGRAAGLTIHFGSNRVVSHAITSFIPWPMLDPFLRDDMRHLFGGEPRTPAKRA